MPPILNIQTLPVINEEEYRLKQFILPSSYKGWKDVSTAFHAGININYPDNTFPDRVKATMLSGSWQDYPLPASFASATAARSNMKAALNKVSDMDLEVRHQIWYQHAKPSDVLPMLINEISNYDAALDAYKKAINAAPPSYLIVL